jgi:hypothetical protein
VPKCSQCGRVAVAQVGDAPLCVDCLYKLRLAGYFQQQQYAQKMNFVLEQAEMMTGIYGGPRVAMPQPPPILRTGPMTFNNIRIDRSVVGAINTAQVQKIDVALSNIKIAGGDKLASQLRDFTEAVIASTELSKELKDDVLGHVSFLAEQVQAQQKAPTATLKTVLGAVATSISVANGLVTLWAKVHPFLAQTLGT